jgi:hypothetical protein
VAPIAAADIRELLPEEVLQQIAAETSGEEAKEPRYADLQHRMRASSQFDEATSHILRKPNSASSKYGGIPVDGETPFGTQKSRRMGCAIRELREISNEAGGPIANALANWEAMPLSLAQDSLRRCNGALVTSVRERRRRTTAAGNCGPVRSHLESTGGRYRTRGR